MSQYLSLQKFPKAARGQGQIIVPNRFFNAHSRFSDKTIRALATDGLDGVEWSYIDTLSRSEKHFQLSYKGTGISHRYDFSLDEGAVLGGNLECLRRDRITGRRMYANSLVVGLVLGFDERHGVAGDIMGGYVWARAGMYVHPEAVDTLSEDLRVRLSAIKEFLKPSIYRRALDLCMLRNPGDLKEIANLSTSFPFIGSLFDVARDADCQDITSFKGYQKLGFFKSGAMTLGEFLLADQEYRKYAHLRDPVQMANIEAFCGVSVRAKAAAFLQQHSVRVRSSNFLSQYAAV
jgi:hypothetical protein